jgi:outer membrane protein assembly factor BamA
LFVPRALLLVPKLVFELVFLPIQALLTVVDRHHLIPRVADLFYFDAAHTAGFYPVLALERGYGLSYGVAVFHDDLFGHGEELSASARYGGRYLQGYQLRLNADRMGGSRLWLESIARYEFEPAILFHGIGDPGDGSVIAGGQAPRDVSIATRFRQERLLGLLRLGGTLGTPGDLTKTGGTLIYNRRIFGGEERGFDEPSIESIYDTSQLAGFDDTVDTIELDANLIRDTREGGPLASNGTYLELFGGGVLPLDRYGYWHFGAELAHYVNLYRRTRVLVLRGAIEGVAGKEERIPFVELPRLGGPQDLRGYVADRFRDKLAAVATIEYRYPIHELLSGALFVDAGKVGRTPNDVFEPSALNRWRVDAGGGLLLHTRESMIVALDVAYGDGLTIFFTTAPIEFFHHRDRRL